MSAANWTAVSTEILAEEGGYVNSPADPGGETNFGISKRAYPGVDIKKLTKGQALDIYHADYWSKIQGDLLPSGVDLALMDYAVNSGVGRAVKCLQLLVGEAPDGVIGPRTLEAVAKMDAAQLVTSICGARLTFLQGLSTSAIYGAGWSNRVARVRKLALGLAGAPSVSFPPLPKPTPPVPAPAPAQNFWVALITAILSLFQRKP